MYVQQFRFSQRTTAPILVLREMQERSYEDIAEILEISIGTVRSRLSRARNQLKVTLEAMENEEESMPGSDSVS